MDAAWILLVLITAVATCRPKEAVAGSPTEPLHRTAYFAGQDGWSGSGSVASPPTSSYDRYGQPIATGQTPVGQPPSISSRAQNAFSETGTAIRDGIEAGIRAGNQQLSNAGSGLAPLSSPFATTTNALPSTNSNVRGGVSAPPWPTNSNTAAQSYPSTPMSTGVSTSRTGSTGPVAIDGGWTSIGTTIAAPPLLIPQSPMTTTNFGNPNAPASRNGSSFPAFAANDQQPLHSVLAEPVQPSQPLAKPADDWTTGWTNNSGGTPAGITRTGSGASLGSTVRQSDLVPVQPAATSPQDPRRQASGRPGDVWAETDPWTQPAQPSLGPATGAASVSKPLATNGAGNSQPFLTNGQTPLGPASNGQSPNGQFTGNFNGGNANPGLNPTGNNANTAGRNQLAGTTTNEPQAWMPMIAAVLSLAGSLAANLYLGVSYLDARQKYQSLVRKTADTFRRVKSAAA